MGEVEKCIEKLSSYDFLNNLLPGAVFCYFFSLITGYKFDNDVIVNVCIYYFAGMLVSRIGSLIIEPLFKKIKIVKYADYDDFLIASDKDEKINCLSQTNNVYRTFLSAFITLSIIKLLVFLQEKYSIFNNKVDIAIAILLVGLLIFSYRKQTDYIRKRVERVCNRS